jgi:CheY-like chemotaxis protein
VPLCRQAQGNPRQGRATTLASKCRAGVGFRKSNEHASHVLTGPRARTYGCAGELAREFRNGAVGEALPSDYFRLSLPSLPSGTAIIGDVTPSVLVVDDDPQFRKLAQRLLAVSGLAVVGEAGSVAAALAAVARFEPSAVLLDVELPDGDGIALARELAALPWRPRVVLTSIDREITTDEEARRAGARAFVHKADLPNAPLAQLLSGN